MIKCLVKVSLILIGTACLISCSSANNKPVLISFSSDSTSIVFSNIDPAGILQVAHTPGIDSSFSQLISVSRLPAEEDSTGMELPLQGKIRISDSTITFLPQQPFIRGSDYLVVTYLNASFANSGMLLSGKLNPSVKPRQVILKR